MQMKSLFRIYEDLGKREMSLGIWFLGYEYAGTLVCVERERERESRVLWMPWSYATTYYRAC